MLDLKKAADTFKEGMGAGVWAVLFMAGMVISVAGIGVVIFLIALGLAHMGVFF